MKLTGAMFITTLTLVGATFGCASEDTGGSKSKASGGSGAASAGDCQAPSCNGCAACFESCYCQTGSIQGCKTACGMGAGGSGAGGSGVGGSGATPGSGGSAPGTGGASGSGAGGTGPGGSGGAPQQVIEMNMDPFTLQPGQETFMCQNFANPLGGADII